MERRFSSHQREDRVDQLATAKPYQPPLLPYERDLLQALGLSEEEYRWFADEVRKKNLETQIDGPVNISVGAILISLAIGAVLTGVSALLAPKPRSPESEKRKPTIQLASQNGRTRFNNTVGFDGAPDLATLGTRIPIVFGMYREKYNVGELLKTASGGTVVEPQVLWTRMTSHGKFQTLKFLAMIGQAEIENKPELRDFFLGGQSIDNFTESNFWLAWKSTKDDNRLYLRDGIYGEAAEGPDGNGGIFTCPTFSGDREPGFSMAYSPANTTSFGVYQTIPNGGNWRLSFDIVPFPNVKSSEKDPRGANKMKRRKIAGQGAEDRDQGMPGIGRPYSTKCGLVAHNGTTYELPTELDVNIGDELIYRIQAGEGSYGDYKIDEDSGVKIEDLNQTMNSIRERADDLLQVGEVFTINRTLVRVVGRPNDSWTRSSSTFDFPMMVIGFTGANRRVGVIGTKNVEKWWHSYAGDDPPLPRFKGTGWYALSKVDFAQVKNTRACEITELGIRSNVWGRVSGLSNFISLPSPDLLAEYDEEQQQITNGTMNKYLRRSSFFMLAVRDVQNIQGLDARGDDDNPNDDLLDGYDILGDLSFCVSNNTPVDVYNYIQIRHPNKGQYEFKLIPKPATTLIQFKDVQNPRVYVLDTAGSRQVKLEASPHYGNFEVRFNATIKPLDELFDLPEFDAGLATTGGGIICRVDKAIHRAGESLGGGYWQAWLEAAFGRLKPQPAAVFGERREANLRASNANGAVMMRCEGYVEFDESRVDRWGTAKYYGFQVLSVEVIEGNIQPGDSVDCILPTSGTWYGGQIGNPLSRQVFEITGDCEQGTPPKTGDRVFEDNAQIKELSPYQEVTKSCDDSPEHRIIYVNESSDNEIAPNYYAMTMAGYKIRSMNNTTNFNQPQIWLKNGISVERLYPDTPTFDPDGRKSYGPSNNFADMAYYMLTNNEPGTGALGRVIQSEMVNRGFFEKTAKFQDNYWMTFDGAIAEQTNLRSYLSELAPMFLSNFTLINGKFGLVPALPVDEQGIIVQGPVPIQMMFNDSNIISGSYKLDFLPQDDRQDFRANMIYRACLPHSLVEPRSILVGWDYGDDPRRPQAVPQEDFDMSGYCTRRAHAFAAARYMLSIRKRVDHTVTFDTVPDGLSLSPGDFIRVETVMSPYENFSNGIVRADGTIVSPTSFKDGIYNAFVYRAGADDVTEEEIEIVDGKVVDTGLYDSLFNIPSIARRLGVYQVEEIKVNEDGIVSITGSHHPVFEDLRSKIVYDVMQPEEFVVIGDEAPQS